MIESWNYNTSYNELCRQKNIKMCGSHLVHCGLLLRNLKQKRQVILLAQWPKHCPLIVETRSQTQRKGVKFAHLDLLL